MVYNFFDKNSASLVDKSVAGSGIKNEIKQNAQLAEELHTAIIRKFEKRKVLSSFKDNIWGADLGDMQLIRQFNKRIRFLLSVLDICSKYALVITLKDKKETTITNASQKILDGSKRKAEKVWADKGSEF